MNCLDRVHKECKEHQIGLWRFARRQQVDARVCCHAPVVVLTTSIDTGKWFFMQQHFQSMTLRHSLHDIHQQGIVVNCEVDLFKYRGALKLCRCNFIMPRADGNAEFVALFFEITHESVYAFGYGAEIMIFELLTFGRSMSKNCTTR